MVERIRLAVIGWIVVSPGGSIEPGALADLPDARHGTFPKAENTGRNLGRAPRPLGDPRKTVKNGADAPESGVESA